MFTGRKIEKENSFNNYVNADNSNKQFWRR